LLCSLAEPLDCGEDFIGGFDPFVWLWVLVVSGNEGDDIVFELSG
jgi:hypothetical protein